MTQEFPTHEYSGARALAMLHERHLRGFLDTWEKAAAAGVTLPKTDDPAYVSMDILLYHVLGAAGSYMVWMCEKLDLPHPGIERPDKATLRENRRAYLEHVLDGWRPALKDVPHERIEGPLHATRWNAQMDVETMLEHAVMHPIRHAFQLERLMEEGG